MPRFSYIAINAAKKTDKGIITAESAFAARKHLRAKGLHPTDIREVAASEAKRRFSLFGKSARGAVTAFTKELSTMLSAGIKLTDALTVLITQIGDNGLRVAVTDIRDRVVTGESFAETLTEYGQYFDVIYVSMMRVGEVTGTLDKSLATTAAFMDKRQRLEAKMTTAMIYPALLIVGSIGAVLIITIKVIPIIAEQISKTGQELPWITRALVSTSEILTSWWVFPILAGLFGIGWGYKKIMRTAKGSYLRDKLLLSLPGIGPLVKQRIVSRFASTLATLLGAGLSMAESLRVVAQVTGNQIMNDAVKQARDRILAGADIATPLRDSGVIDPSVAHMVAVGEKSGELEQMLKIISENLDASSDLVIERLSAAIEPVIIVVMALVIGVIAYATMKPLIKFSAGQF
jgi:type II secretory pathway component PulF